ncbi:MAG: Ig-like domain repeat protein, partial [Vicinamibacteria bacterium]|nr:Ig-like domain repeat protein [Vicinamibacteria bacterium]
MHRAVALLLTWAMPGSSALALTPPVPPLPSALPLSAGMAGLGAPLPGEEPGAGGIAAEPLFPVETPMLPAAIAHDDDDDDDHGLRPILECVVRHSSSSYTAYFGFKNETSQSISIPVGSSNAFSPAPQNRNQPTTFPKGRSPYYPNAAFSVPFNGSNLTWTLRGPGNHARSVTAKASSPRCQAPPSPTPTPTATPTPIPTPTPPLVCASPVYGPTRFTRTCDDHGPTVYNRTFALPAGASGPFTLRVRNGDTQGRNKATAAEVKINGVAIVGDSDFSNNVVTFTKTIATLAATNQLYVRVKGAPGSTFTIEICGANQGDAIPPTVDWLTPLEGEILRDPAPLYRVRYSDAGSGLALSTLKILVDGADQTAAFNPQPDEASYDSTAPLADGTHTLRAEIKDVAGNTGAATRTFRVDATDPAIAVAEPASGALTRVVRPQIRLTFADGGTLPSGVDPATLSVSIDGVDVTSAFSVSGGVATGTAPQPLANGSHRIDASISDRVGNQGAAFALFTIDTVAPVLTPISPAQGQMFGTASVPVLVQYADDHALNVASFTATLDGAPFGLTVDADSASGTAVDLADGPHTLALSIADQAGNVKTSTVSFTTDTGKPEIFIVPANGQAINSRNPEILVTYSDAQGIAPGTLKITVNGVVRTAEFTQTGTEARATLADLLPVGTNVIAAEVRDGASNLGATTAAFTVDVTPPVITVVSPAGNAFLNDTTPDIEITLQDEATGIASEVTKVLVDSHDVTADFVLGAAGARGTLSTPLAEGPHTLEILAADGAANPATLTTTFHIDLTPPALDFASPRVDGYTNDPTPEIWLRLTDPVGPSGQTAAGINLASARVYVLSEDPGQPDADITSLLTPTAVDIGLRGELAVALGDGSHRLRATVRDAAGNESSLTVGFVVDTEAPTVVIDQPQLNTFLNSAEPTIVLLYNDTRSGVASDLIQVTVDGIERAASLVPAPGGATLTLSRSQGFDLADGPHQVEARVVDLAGNATDAIPVTFGVDTVAPVASVQAPVAQSFTGSPTPAIRFTLTDIAPSSGVNPDFAKVFIDGLDITASVTFTTTGGAGEPVVVTGVGAVSTPLGDGLHTLRITGIDNANNQVELIVQFTVDTAAPVVNPEIPPGGATIGGGGVSQGGTTLITGTLNDLDPGLSVTCSAGGVTVTGSISNGSYSCNLPVTEGVNQVTVTVTDSTGHTTTTTRDLTLDRTAPVVVIDSPAATDAIAAQFISVLGHVQDATAVSVIVNGVTATVMSISPGVASFAAAN